MNVRVRLFALVREAVGTREETVEIAAGTTVGELWQQYVARAARLANLQVAFAVNHTYVSGDHPLHEGDTVAFIPPVSGGMP